MTKSISIYTDGSKITLKDSEEKPAGCGWIMYNNGRVIEKASHHLGIYTTVYGAECYAMLDALRYLKENEKMQSITYV